VDWLLSLAYPWAYVTVAVLAAAEAAAFAGLVIPGETAMLLGGVLVFQGRADLAPMLAAGCLGALAGDSIGYEIGRRFEARVRDSRLGRRVGAERWDRAEDYVRRRGGKAVFFGRFVGVLRALVPAMAGMARMPYRTFLVYNAAGGILWATGFILLGVAAGGSWHLVERWAGRAALLLLALLAGAVVAFLGARYAIRRQTQILTLWRTLLEQPRVRRLRRRFGPQLEFLGRRLDPRSRFGLYLTFGVLVSVLMAWAFGAVLEDVLGHDELALVDRPIERFFIRHREPLLTTVMKGVTFLGSAPLVSGVLAAAVLLAWRRARPGVSVFLGICLLGGQVLDDIVKSLVDRPRPDISALVQASGSSFPSGHATAGATLCLGLAYVFTRGRDWAPSIWIWTAGGLTAILIGLSRVYLGVHWPTDVIGGLALGSAWTAVCATAMAVLGRPSW
jgi:membrane protein DedA with SNARE-associated domain/membrane-associated phospholipid phosphatase